MQYVKSFFPAPHSTNVPVLKDSFSPLMITMSHQMKTDRVSAQVHLEVYDSITETYSSCQTENNLKPNYTV